MVTSTFYRFVLHTVMVDFYFYILVWLVLEQSDFDVEEVIKHIDCHLLAAMVLTVMKPDLWLCVSREVETVKLFECLHHFIMSTQF